MSTSRRGLLSLGTVLVAAALAASSGANFTATSANNGNTIKAGIVAFTTTASGTAVLTTAALAPGHSDTDSVDIVNTGDLPSTYKLTATNLVDLPASPALSAKLELTIQDLGDPRCASSCPAATTVYSGKLGALSSAILGSWAPNAQHRIAFTVTFPDGSADNPYQSARSTLDLTWNATG